MRTKKEWACIYSAKGYTVIPLAPNGKTPLNKLGKIENIQYRTPGEIHKIWNENPNANIGIVCNRNIKGNGLTCIDLDNHNSNGIESLSKWIEVNNDIDSNWICQTPNNGIHLYFDDCIDSQINLLPGVDIISKNRFIVMPPSTIDGKPYTWKNEKDILNSKPVIPGENVMNLFKTRPIKKKNAPDQEESERILEGNRVNALVSECGKLKNLNLKKDEIKQIVRYKNENECMPPLTKKELELEVFPCLDRFDSKKKQKKEIKIVDGKQLEAMETKPTEFLIDNFLPSVGIGCISAPPKSFKSYMALDLALSVADGKTFLGYDTKKGNVLYLDLESSYNRTKQRIYQMNETFSENFFLITANEDVPTLNGGFIETMDSIIKDYNIKLLIIDVFARIKGFSTSKNEYQNDYNQMKDLQKLAIDNDMFILFIHHNRKMKAKDPFEQLNGSTALFGSLDFCLVINRDRYQQNAVFCLSGRDLSEEREIYTTFNKKTMKWENNGSAQEIRQELEKERFLQSDTTQAINQLIEKYGRIETNAQEIINLSLECNRSIDLDPGMFGQFMKKNKDLFIRECGIKAIQCRNHQGRYWIIERLSA